MALKPLDRRTLLRGMVGGLGAAVSLPLLEAMLDSNGEALADGTALPKRFMSWMFGNGVRLDRFIPEAQYPDPWALSPALAPLAAVKDYITVLTGFNNHSAHFITHHEGNTVFSGHDIVDVGQGQGFFSNAGGPTLDQVIANLPIVGDQTPIRSIQLATSKRPSNADFGTTTHSLSHRDYQQPLPGNYNPQEVWSLLFDSFIPPEDPSKELKLSVLDIVKANVGKLRKRIGKADDIRLEAHLDGIAELEKKIAAIPPLCVAPEIPGESNTDMGGVEPLTAVSDAMADLLVYAFKCDITRVASNLFVEPAALTIYSELGHNSAHHDLTHSNNQDAVHDGVVYAMERFAYYVQRFAEEEDAAGTCSLLDTMAMFCSSDVSEGLTHSINDQPMIIAGKAADQLIFPGIHYRSQSGENPSDVLLALLQMFDPTAIEVGSGAPMSNTPFNLIKAGG